MAASRDEKAHGSNKRPARVPMTGGNKLTIPPHLIKEGFQYYWGIDQKGMIEQMEAAYWEKVLDHDNKPLTVPAGNGETHYAMRIEQKYYDEDMARQQKQNIETTNKTAQALGEEEYIPQGHTQVTERELI